jgi:hypothetical protein|tara:strand:- start:1629 stop:2444 length:816 start_codon:yes stop_codon:yes gene_type:complete
MTTSKKSNDNITNFQSDISIFTSLYFLILIIILLFKCIADLNTSINYTYSYDFINLIYVLLLSILTALFVFSSCFKLTRNDLVCDKMDFNTAIYSTTIPYLIIYVVGVSLLLFFPGWIRGFSNTYGSTISSLISGINFKLHDGRDINDQATTQHFIKQFYSDPLRLFHELRINNIIYDEENNRIKWDDLDTLLNTMDINESILNKYRDIDFKKTLYNYIIIKNNIGTTIWIFLLGIITFLSSITHLLSSSCNTYIEDDAEFQNMITQKFIK